MNPTHISKFIRLAALIACALPTTTLAAPNQLYRITDLGVIAGANSSAALGINDLGQVTGGSGSSAFYWSPQVGMVDMGIPATYNSAAGVAINNAGQIAVSTTKGMNGSFQGHAFRWTGGVYEDLGTLGGSFSAAYGIDDLGRIAGIAYTPFPSNIHAYRSTTGTSLIDIDGLGGNYSLGYGMNASGHVVGEAYTAGQQYHAFYWPGTGPMQDLGTIGGTQSRARDISDNGLVVGVSTIGVGGPVHAFLYQNGAMTDLGSLTAFSSWGYAVNNAGTVIGQYATPEGYGRPFIWDSANGMRDLNTLLDPVTGAGWQLLDAEDLNNNGQIVGQGFRNGQARAVLLTPIPEPSAMILLAWGATIALLKWRR